VEFSPAEALQRAGARACLSHESAAQLLGIELLDPRRARITVPRSRSRLTIPGWDIVRADVGAADRELANDLPFTGAVRTAVDLCRVLPFEDAVVAVDSTLRAHPSLESELMARLTSSWGRGASALRAVAAAADPLSGSVLETLLRLVLRDARLSPLSQQVIRDRDGSFVARVDFCWPAERLVVEADGFAYHSDRAAYRKDRERLNALERLGWRVLRFTWEDVRGRPTHVVACVRECLAAAAA
jgi:very-short-patch-repair endonuclease